MKKRKKRYRQHQRYLHKWLRFGTYAGGLCERCGEELIYIWKYDAVCCPTCNQWIEKKCGDPNCPYCAIRPDSPLEDLRNEEENKRDSKVSLIHRFEKREKGRRIRKKKENKLWKKEKVW